jgi:hypothetical protein
LPLVKPVTVMGDALPVTVPVTPPSLDAQVIANPVMTAPPLKTGAVNVTDAWALPAVAVPMVGASGTVAARVTVVVYVCTVTPSCAVTAVVMVLLPMARGIVPLALPLDTIVPLTLAVALLSVTVGVTVIPLVAYGTEAV